MAHELPLVVNGGGRGVLELQRTRKLMKAFTNSAAIHFAIHLLVPGERKEQLLVMCPPE